MTLSESEPISVERIGPYPILRYLTAGGMADLYLCRDPRQGLQAPPLVLKRVQTRYLSEPRVLAMFRDEAQIGRLLDHPNIVRTYEIGEAGGYLYIAMEYIEGHDLIEILRTATQRRIAVPRDIGVSLVAQVARALSYAHDLRDAEGRSLEIVHCDVSPGNIMISWRGAVKLVDFGVSRAKIPLHCPDRGVAGKYNYMAPEQITGGRIDRRADLFALGVILYELTCGQRLFRGRPESVMQQVVGHDIAPPRQVLPDYPPELEAIVLRALQRDPQMRYPTAEALRVDLAAFLERSSKSGRAHGKRELGRFLRTVFGVPEQEVEEPRRLGRFAFDGAQRGEAPSFDGAQRGEAPSFKEPRLVDRSAMNDVAPEPRRASLPSRPPEVQVDLNLSRPTGVPRASPADYELRISAADEPPSKRTPLPDLLRATDLAVTPALLLRIDDEPDGDISGEISGAINRALIDRDAQWFFDRDAPQQQRAFDRDARSAAVTDRDARSAAVTDRDARSAAVTDREVPQQQRAISAEGPAELPAAAAPETPTPAPMTPPPTAATPPAAPVQDVVQVAARHDEPTHLLSPRPGSGGPQPPGQLLAPVVIVDEVPARRRASRDALLWLVPLALLVFIGLYYMAQR